MPSKVRTLIVDDSAYMRVVLKDMLESDEEIEVVGMAKDGLEAIDRTKELSPDVVLLDIQMPRMDGLATLQRIMKETPTRVVMLSAMDKADNLLPLRALEMGAVDFISKPSGPVSVDIVSFSDRICEIIKNSSAARVDVLRRTRAALPPKLAAVRKELAKNQKVIALGASLGGPRALEFVFAALPKELPASFFIVQHIAAEFSGSFAKRLDGVQGPRVLLAEDEAKAERGSAYLAPGGRHLVVGWKGTTRLLMRLTESQPVNHVRPSADVLFESVAEAMAENAMAIVMTGMGVDGAKGAMAIRKAGGRVIAQDERTSLAYGMPKAVAEAGTAHRVLPLEEISKEIVRFLEV
ncbi:MAG: chemotaxis-specific protein-glutamate methyltransferase CheB [Candidatus Thermoplasmatota archaeon]|nr:chemotaxis-specific protein-glutamate methyltransferase CheB [Candidatus Thermoplasmatota archaeon]